MQGAGRHPLRPRVELCPLHLSCHIQCLLSPRPRTKLVRLLSPSFEQSQQEAKGGVQADVGSEESQREAWHRGRFPGSRCSCQRTPGSLYPQTPGVEGQTPPRGAEAARGPGEAVWEQGLRLQPGGEHHHRADLPVEERVQDTPACTPPSPRQGEEADMWPLCRQPWPSRCFSSLIQLNPHDPI